MLRRLRRPSSRAARAAGSAGRKQEIGRAHTARPWLSRLDAASSPQLQALASSPFVRFTAAELLETLVQMDEHAARLAGSRLRGVAGPLVGLIDAEAASEVQLPLLSLYVELGLHTNAAAVSDKNGDRFRIMSVLRALWQQPQPWRALQAAAAASLEPGGGGDGGAAFGEFAETLVKEAVFLLADALGRLADVHTRQEEMPASVRRGDKAASLPAPPPASAADKEKEAAWAALSGKERQAREARLEQCRRTAKGFLQLARSSLAALLFLTDEAGVCSAFASHPSRASKLAAMLVEFLRKLCDVKAREGLRVDQPDKLGWQPKKRLSDTRPYFFFRSGISFFIGTRRRCSPTRRSFCSTPPRACPPSCRRSPLATTSTCPSCTRRPTSSSTGSIVE